MSDKNIEKSIESLETIAEYIGENYFFSKQGIRNLKNNIKNVLSELETYKKIAKKLESMCESYGIDADIDWARKEVEKDEI